MKHSNQEKIEKILKLPYWTFWAKMNDLSFNDPELYMEIIQRLEAKKVRVER